MRIRARWERSQSCRRAAIRILITGDDPDAGVWSYGYDAMGSQTSVTDARGTTTYTVYDELGRPRELRRDGPTGPVLATWSYDAAGEKGLLDRSTRVTSSGNWVTDVTGYDARSRPTGTTLTVPSGVPGLSGSYAVSQTYDRADHVTSTTYPAVGGLPAETVTTRYNSLGLPESMSSPSAEYVWSAVYDNRGRSSSLGLGPRPNGQTWLARSWSYDNNQRLARMQTAVNGSLAVDHQYTYDVEGTLEERTTQQGSESWRECFDYDLRNRLTRAFTVTASATCSGGTPGTGGQPYEHTYRYGVDGNLLERTEDGVTETYQYPAAGADRPHAPTQVGHGTDQDTYQWDANGALASRTVDGATETLAWDAERRLASVTGTDGTDSFLYDADGVRLLRTTPQGRTLYFAGHEVNANTSGSTVTAVRSYSFAGGLVATRTPSGVDYVITDQQGSVEASAASGGSLETTRSYDPYGRRRSGGELDTDQGWIGQVEDDTTGLAYLNSRYYDPNIGTFISPDPMFNAGDPKSLNAYSYANNNPVNGSDPTGDCMPMGGYRSGCVDIRWGAKANIGVLARYMKARRGTAGASRSIDWWRDHIRGKWQESGAYGRINAYAQGYRVGGPNAARAARNLVAMYQTNPNPSFWRALSAAGSGSALVLTGMRAVNPDPGFWKMISAFQWGCGPGCTSQQVGRRIQEAIAEIQRGRALAEIASDYLIPSRGGGGAPPVDNRVDNRNDNCSGYNDPDCVISGHTGVITSGGGRGSRVGYSLDGGVSFNGGGGNPPDYVSLPSLREAATAVLGCVVNSGKYVPAGAYGGGRIGTAVGHPVAGTAAGASLGLLVGCAEGMIDPNPPGMP